MQYDPGRPQACSGADGWPASGLGCLPLTQDGRIDYTCCQSSWELPIPLSASRQGGLSQNKGIKSASWMRKTPCSSFPHPWEANRWKPCRLPGTEQTSVAWNPYTAGSYHWFKYALYFCYGLKSWIFFQVSKKGSDKPLDWPGDKMISVEVGT